MAQQLLVPGGADGYVFRHALIREALYTDLLPGERTRLHARFAELLADPARLAAVPGSAAELAHHCLASHDITGAFAASVRAGQESERLAAPAEAHRHYDAALALWERVSEPERLAGQDRDHLAFCSANCAASSGEIARAVQQLRRIVGFLREGTDPVLASRVHERLAYYLLELDAAADADTAAQAAVQLLPADPPRPQRARALATHAQTLMHAGDEAAAARRAQEARLAARAADAPWVEADALVTLGLLAERQGEPAQALDLFSQAYREAQALNMLGVELRAAFQVARSQLESGDLAGSAATAHQGFGRADAAGLGLAPYGLDLQYLHYLAHYADGCWDHAQELADGFGVRVTTAAEARLSAMALFLDVARGSPKVADRRAWLEPFWPGDSFGAYIARGLLAEHALWRGDLATALAEIAATLAELDTGRGYGPPAIRVAAVGLAARGEQARRARAAGHDEAAAAEVAAAQVLIDAAREGAAFPRRPKFVLGVDGRGWLARAEAEWSRAQGRNDPEAWQAVVDEFGPAFSYETARSRWRLAEALAEAGHRPEAEREWSLALAVADELGATPLASALRDLGRRARLARPAGDSGAGGGSAGGPGGGPADVLAGLTGREREVLRLLVAGRSNREIAATLFIAPKTASVHVSNILAKLNAASRGEAAAIAAAAGLAGRPLAGPRPPPVRSWPGPRQARSGRSGSRAGLAAGRELGEDLLGPGGRAHRVRVGRADQRIPVQVVEDLGHPLPGQPLHVAADVGEAAGQQHPAAALRHGHRRARPDHAAAHDPDRAGVAAGFLGRRPHHADPLADPGQVGPAGGDPAVGQPPGPLQGGRGAPADQDRRTRPLHRVGREPARGQLVVPALEAGRALRPDPAHDLDVLAGAHPPAGHHAARHGELLRQPADAQPEVEPAPGQHVRGGGHLGQVTRREVGHVHHRDTEPDPPGHRGQVAQGHHRVEHAVVDGVHGRAFGHHEPLERPERGVAGGFRAGGERGEVVRGRPHPRDRGTETNLHSAQPRAPRGSPRTAR